MELKIPFGLRGQELLHVSEVDRGLACDCVCPACKHPLVAKKGKGVIHHFAHHGDSSCKHAVETALHMAAKHILESERRILVPAVKVEFEDSYKKPWIVYKEDYIQFDEVQLEKRIDDIVPDVLVYVKGKPLMVEIAVTHPVDENKLQRIRKIGISALEIRMDGSLASLTYEEIRNAIISVQSRKWLFNTKVESIKRRLYSLVEYKKHVHHGCALHVENCPISKRIWHGKPYANIIDDCICCEYCIDAGTNASQGVLLCTGKRRLSSYQDYLKAVS